MFWFKSLPAGIFHFNSWLRYPLYYSSLAVLFSALIYYCSYTMGYMPERLSLTGKPLVTVLFFSITVISFLYLYLSAKRQQMHVNQQNYLIGKKDDQLQRAVKRLELLFALIHDLSSPVQAILCAVTHTSTDKPNIEAADATVLKAGAEKLLEIVGHVMALAKISPPSPEALNIETFILSGWLNDIVAIAGVKARAKDVELHLQPIGIPPYFIETDRFKLTRIIDNLLDNAIRYTPAGKKITLSYEAQPGKQLRIEVQDEGIGIEKEKLELVFEPYVQAGSDNFGNCGLGLSVVKELTGLMGGDVSITSTVGRGSSFLIQLPLSIPSNATPPKFPFQQSQTGTLGGLQLLIIEDDKNLAGVLKRRLENEGAIVTLAYDGIEGLQLAIKLPVDLLIVDNVLPGRNGLEVVRQLRATGKETPVIAMVTDQFDFHKVYTASGVNCFIEKPFPIEELKQKIMILLGKQ